MKLSDATRLSLSTRSAEDKTGVTKHRRAKCPVAKYATQ